MALDIKKQIENIDNSLKWIKQYHPEHYEQRFLQLIEERRKLKSIEDVENDNPAIAAYGVSQVGKSYLMNCMLQKNGRPFVIKAEGQTYNFIEEMNPKTDNTEATGVVTRFSSFSKNPDSFSTKYPVMMRCLTVADIVLVVCDGYYKDITGYTTFSEAEITIMAEEIYKKYITNSENYTSPIQADNILDIKAYFYKHLSEAQAFQHTDYFQKLALVANRIPVTDWVDVFSILWCKSPYQTKLFTKLLATLAKFKYAKYVYLPPQALLHDGINENTVMSVQCLNQLFIEQPTYFTDVYLREGNTENYQQLQGLTKSEVCAVCAEIIVKIGEEYLENSSSYCFTNIAPDIASKLTQGEVKMNILKENDMLDFPGARSRKKLAQETMKEDSNLITVLLRGKVAYLFNMYNEAKRINILLYCHHQEKNEVSDIPNLLRDWIMNNIGNTMEHRRRTMSITDNISPLFYVGTKFNLDMRERAEVIENTINGMNGRWQQRFKKTLYDECFAADATLDAEGQKIFLNWTRPDEHFHNSYVLRDYKFSGPKGNSLYDNERSQPDTSRMLMPEDYYRSMRKTFCESEFVKCFFNNPELSWDVAASINNDGALYIIENLSKVADKITNTRTQLFNDVIAAALKNIFRIMKEYYVSDDTSELLSENIRKADSIMREMEFTCQEHPEYFGHLLQALQLTEAESFKELHHLIPTLTATVNDNSKIADYELIRKRCNNFEGCRNEAEKWAVFIAAYRFANQEEADRYLQSRHIDAGKLFQGETLKRKNSAVITHSLVNHWKENISGVQFMNSFAGQERIDEIVMTHLVTCLMNTAATLNLAERIENEIADYVDVLNITGINEDLVADMIATTISDFVIDFGYRYLTPEQIQASRRISQDQKLNCFHYTQQERKEHFEDEEMTQLFNDILTSDAHYTPAYNDNYNRWLEFMYVAFIAHLNVPEYDREANEQLKQILDEIKK
ncbi:MAG: hypothetical protein J1E02_03895 [Coprobacter sp.]|nr:hypothetical protein [Coprobacter sp.]